MSVRPIAEVRQRQGVDPLVSRELGFFTDTSMAQQVIDACYRQAWSEIMKSDFIPTEWFPQDLRDVIALTGFDRWAVDDKNGPAPMFYQVTHKLWNQVPSNMSGFNFTMEGAMFNL